MKPLAILRTTLTTAALLAAALPAHAVGRLADIQVVDRDSGETLTVYRHQGEHWVAGRPGARYAVSVRNATAGRVLGVVSVDGVNVISGETAAWQQTGYVLSPWQQHAITGWRKSDAEVAAFHFTASSASYAERTGRPAHVGVIGVAVFREKPLPPPPPAVLPWPSQCEPGAAESRSSAPSSAADTTAEAQANNGAPRERAESLAARRMAPAAPMPAPRLGTGHGEREASHISHTTFERRSERPDELVRIRYDSRENLIAMGIIPTQAVPLRPNPFPAGVQPGYAPDPR
ncbi:hypothetical protein ASE11_05395 [Hydrogenophaga sp. Root209]|uniref:hypothetical protein n=1 Tax=Hydrogenophaga sp. Root209 TaxID=1736490 RepID=UPI0006F48AA7|nr:hypothetical protein [Hydrogenophaga sp. Root209]KRC01071.1 hypothetical protein ASE11_05395 [Hydrogenophaga sp. Root209]